MKKSYTTLAVIGFVTVLYSSVLVIFGHEILSGAFSGAALHYPVLVAN
jgi:hypothetical protein